MTQEQGREVHTEMHERDRIVEVLNAERVRWRWNHSSEWQYGKPISYLDKPAYIVEREGDGKRVAVLIQFNPEPVAKEDGLERVLMRADTAWTGMSEASRPAWDTFVAEKVREYLQGVNGAQTSAQTPSRPDQGWVEGFVSEKPTPNVVQNPGSNARGVALQAFLDNPPHTLRDAEVGVAATAFLLGWDARH